MNTANHYTPLTSTSELPLTVWTVTPFKWNILKTIGIPPKLVDIIKTLYSSTHSVVRVNGTISEAFSISSGVRQGCVLATNLFNTATDRILNITTQALTLGMNYDDSGQLITDLDYADDIAIFADLPDTLKDALFIFNEQSQKLGLHVNWSKTKVQSFSPWMPTPPSTLIGTQPVTTTDNFTYLDSTIASNDSNFNDVNRCIATSTMSKLSSIYVPCPKDAPLQLTHNLDNHLQLSLMDPYQSPEETPRHLQHKSPPPHCGRPLVRLHHERLNTHPHRTTTPSSFPHLFPLLCGVDVSYETPPFSTVLCVLP